MQIEWFLNSKTQTCDWTFRFAECLFQTGMPLQEFFLLVEQLYEARGKLKALMEGGLDPQAAIAEWERMIRGGATVGQFQQASPELKNEGGQVVGVTDKLYELPGAEVVFDEVLLKAPVNVGDVLWYNGKSLHVAEISQFASLLVDMKGARGPVIKGVKCLVEA